MTHSRRKWLAGTTATLASGAITSSLSAVEKDSLPIVDTHQHLWDLTKLKLPWLGTEGELSKSFVMKDYLAATEGLNMTKAVYMEVDVAEDQKDLEAEQLIKLTKEPNQPTVAAVIGCRPTKPEFVAYVKRYKDQKVIKGFRQVQQNGEFGEQFVKNMQLLGELDKSFDLCLPAKDVGATIKVVDAAPDTRFILDHCGNADVKAFLPAKRRGDAQPGHDVDAWKRAVELLAKRGDRIICKISGIIAGVPKEWSSEDLAPIINHCLDAFGSKRVVFGSDWPVCLKGATLKQWVTALKEIIAARPLEEQKQLLADNAIRFYRL